MANALKIGLGASVWSADPEKAREVAARIRAGTVWINKHEAVDPRVPFGGTEQSGYGPEFGVEGPKHPLERRRSLRGSRRRFRTHPSEGLRSPQGELLAARPGPGRRGHG